jgi:hypothetical protein
MEGLGLPIIMQIAAKEAIATREGGISVQQLLRSVEAKVCEFVCEVWFLA